MTILAIDSTTSKLCVGIQNEGAKFQVSIDAGLQHGERIIDLIDLCRKKVDAIIDSTSLVICASGPGSITSLRIGLASSKGIVMGTGAKLITIPSLDLYAYGKDYFNGIVLPIISSGRKTFYTATYENGLLTSPYLDLSHEKVLDILAQKNYCLITGPDANFFKDDLIERSGIFVDELCKESTALNLIQLALKTIDLSKANANLYCEPIYLRKSEAEENALLKKL